MVMKSPSKIQVFAAAAAHCQSLFKLDSAPAAASEPEGLREQPENGHGFMRQRGCSDSIFTVK